MNCPKCEHEFIYLNAINKKKTLLSTLFNCPNCNIRLTMDKSSSQLKIKGIAFLTISSAVFLVGVNVISFIQSENRLMIIVSLVGTLLIYLALMAYGSYIFFSASKKSYCVEVNSEDDT